MQEKELEEQEKRDLVEDVVPPQTNAAAWEAASLLIQYIESTDTPEGTAADPYFHSLEQMLVKEVHFGNKKQSSIIDFFSQNVNSGADMHLKNWRCIPGMQKLIALMDDQWRDNDDVELFKSLIESPDSSTIKLSSQQYQLG
ncbi:hypothetical protein DFH28DRAFT_925102 [Melampsora americana]|nr:hypothetical protein DFH28DRAFT_925102 [Melampsora americana]